MTQQLQSKIFFTEPETRHILKTQTIAIQNLLIIRKNKPFNSFQVKESERLIRSQKFINDVSFQVVSTGKKSDSVDIYIREQDKWSIIPEGAISSSLIKADLTDKNFLGTGHEFRNIYIRNLTDNITFFNTYYSIPNIKNTYINTKLNYGFDGYKNFKRSLVIDRPFFSPFAKWAAGIAVTSEYKKDTLKYINPIKFPFNLRFNTQDLWGGYAMQIFKGNTENELATNLIFTLSFLRVHYRETPSDIYDPLHNFSNEFFYLTGIGISTRKYVQDKYVFNYGITEDVPVGKVYGLTGGYQIKNNSGRSYLGMRYSSGDYHEWGYMSYNVEYGTFFHGSAAQQGTISAGVNYFTGLFEIGRWKLRQFIKPQITFGINRFAYDSLTLNDGYGLNGFNSTILTGTNRLLVSLQTQLYSPWNFIGFHFGPYLSYSFAMLGDASTGFRNSKIYSQLGIGVLIKNENLVFNTFQFSVSFYPNIPGIGQNIFKMNSFRTTDMGFRDFEIGKPSIVMYQ